VLDEINIESWTDFKSLISIKSGVMQYQTQGSDYVIWFMEGNIRYTHAISITSPANTDQTDFENNYKDDCNKPVFIGEDEIIHELVLRDTDDHISNVSDNRGAIPKTVVIYNETDQDITVQLQGDRDSDFDVAMDMGNPFVIDAGTHDYATISDYLPYLRVKITASTAPTSGTVDAYIMRVKS